MSLAFSLRRNLAAPLGILCFATPALLSAGLAPVPSASQPRDEALPGVEFR